MKWNAYWRLARFNKPAGTLLLWCPTAWALWVANKGFPPGSLVFLFALGTVLMRAAGCVFNDIADRHVDKHVRRTKLRPLTAGEVSLTGAFLFLLMLLAGALIIVINLPSSCFFLSLIALVITVIYPFGKRFLQAPQMILGLAFSMGMPIAFSASGVVLTSESLILLGLINFAWIIAYDTMYAMMDKTDDLKVGIKSTAIYFASYDRFIIASLLLFLHGLWLYWALINGVDKAFYGVWLAAFGVLVYQYFLIRNRDPELCYYAFRISIHYGLLMWLAVGVAFL